MIVSAVIVSSGCLLQRGNTTNYRRSKSAPTKERPVSSFIGVLSHVNQLVLVQKFFPFANSGFGSQGKGYDVHALHGARMEPQQQ